MTGKNFSFNQCHNKEFCIFSQECYYFYKTNRTLFSSVCIAWYKHSRGWENSRQLCKPETIAIANVFLVCIAWYKHERAQVGRIRDSYANPRQSRVYIRLCKQGKCLLLLLSRVCITVSNSPNPLSVYIRLCKQGKRLLLLKYQIQQIIDIILLIFIIIWIQIQLSII